MKQYPDISDVLAKKATDRRSAPTPTFGEKIAMVEALRERLKPLKTLREAKRPSGKPI
jgi:hypothetical protein